MNSCGESKLFGLRVGVADCNLPAGNSIEGCLAKPDSKIGVQENPRAATLASDISNRLKAEIITATLKPGRKLKIAELSDKYVVGLAPIREALNRLSAEKLVVQTDQRGFTVAPISEHDHDDLLKARCWLNGVALKESIENGGAEWEEEVLLACHRLLKTPRQNPEWEELHRNFHKSLLAACGSNWVLSFCDQLFIKSERYRNVARYADAARSSAAAAEHREIAEVAVARRVDVASRLLNDHFMRTALIVRKRLFPHALEAWKQEV
jgi:DNA-binding GntR family transcriptional regulator